MLPGLDAIPLRKDWLKQLLRALGKGGAAPVRTGLGSGATGDALFLTATAAAARALLPIQSGTAVNTSSGTSVDFTGIPSWVKRVTVQFSAVSTNGTSNIMVQIGDSGGIETAGYLGTVVQSFNAATATTAAFTTGCGVTATIVATSVINGTAVLTLLDASTNTWTFTCTVGFSDAAGGCYSGSSKSLSATLDRVRITTVGGVNTFDAGAANILYE